MRGILEVSSKVHPSVYAENAIDNKMALAQQAGPEHKAPELQTGNEERLTVYFGP